MIKILLIQLFLLLCAYSLTGQTNAPELKTQTPGHELLECPDLLTLSGPIIKDLYQAKDIHLTDVVVFPIIELSLISETQVDLNSQIEVPLGSTLTVDINDCPRDMDDPDHYSPINSDVEKRTNQ